MNNWNRTAKIKAIVIGLLALPNLFISAKNVEKANLVIVLIPLIFGSIVIPLIAKFNESVNGRELLKPSWNDNPFNLGNNTQC